MDHIYIIQQQGSRLFKFGVSNNPKRRLQTLQTGNPQQLGLLVAFPCQGISAYAAEATIHRYLGPEHVKGEWFRIESDDRLVQLAQTIKSAVQKKKQEEDPVERMKREIPDAPTTALTRAPSTTTKNGTTPRY